MSKTLFRCTECKFAIYRGTYVTTFSNAGTPLRKDGRVMSHPFIRSAAWAEFSTYLPLDNCAGTKKESVCFGYCLAFCLLTTALLL